MVLPLFGFTLERYVHEVITFVGSRGPLSPVAEELQHWLLVPFLNFLTCPEIYHLKKTWSTCKLTNGSWNVSIHFSLNIVETVGKSWPIHHWSTWSLVFFHAIMLQHDHFTIQTGPSQASNQPFISNNEKQAVRIILWKFSKPWESSRPNKVVFRMIHVIKGFPTNGQFVWSTSTSWANKSHENTSMTQISSGGSNCQITSANGTKMVAMTHAQVAPPKCEGSRVLLRHHPVDKPMKNMLWDCNTSQ